MAAASIAFNGSAGIGGGGGGIFESSLVMSSAD